MIFIAKEISNSQHRKYQLTINNPLPDYSHNQIKEILATQFPSFVYAAMVDENGVKEHTPHTHVYVCFKNGVRFGTLKKKFPTSHIEVAKGSVKQNLDYLKKAGKWAETEKSESTIEGSFEELGERPPENKGTRGDLEALYQMIVEEELSNAEILRINNDYILQIDKLDKIRTMHLQDKFRGTRRLDLEVTYVFGVTGAGKSRDILDTYGDENVYRITDYTHPWDNYQCESVAVFEEFRSSLQMQEMLNYLDIYPIQLKARYSNKYACFTRIFICTNWKLEQQYTELQERDSESWKAFLRRIHNVKEYTKDGIIDYSSVEEYLNRKTSIIPVKELTEEEQLEIDSIFPPLESIKEE